MTIPDIFAALDARSSRLYLDAEGVMRYGGEPLAPAGTDPVCDAIRAAVTTWPLTGCAKSRHAPIDHAENATAPIAKTVAFHTMAAGMEDESESNM